MTQPHVVKMIKGAAAKVRWACTPVLLPDSRPNMFVAYHFIITTERSSRKLLESQENHKIRLPTILAMPPILNHSYLVRPYHLSFAAMYNYIGIHVFLKKKSEECFLWFGPIISGDVY